MKKTFLTLCAALFALSTFLQTNASAQRMISYQGIVANNGTPISGPHSLILSIYKTETGGTAVFQETQNVTFTSGLYDVLIGKVSGGLAPLAFALPGSNHYWLGVQVDGAAELSPRAQLSDVPSAFFADTANFARMVGPQYAVTSINGQSGAITLQGGGGTTINNTGSTITISSSGGGGTGIQGVQNTDNTLSITNANGPTATINMASTGTAGTYTKVTTDAKGRVTAGAQLAASDIPAIAESQVTNLVTDLAAKATSSTVWSLAGNSGTVPGTNFIGTTDNKSLQFRANNVQAGLIETGGTNNTGFGYGVLKNNTTGSNNCAIGDSALYSNISGSANTASGYQALFSNTTGPENTASGRRALYSNTFGQWNTASGSSALYSNTGGSANTASGCIALYSNTMGSDNTASGFRALNNNTTGGNNTANGYQALYSNTGGGANTASGCTALNFNTTGNYNTASGYGALGSNTTGYENTASGYLALYSNITGNYNAASGDSALYSNTTGDSNTASGHRALYSNTTGSDNTASGSYALYSNTTGFGNTASGSLSLRTNATGYYNTAIGFGANVSAATGINNSTVIGANASVTASNNIVLGDNQITSLRCNVQSISSLSDARVKDDIIEGVRGLDFILRLRPVTYRLNLAKELAITGGQGGPEYPGKHDVEKIVYSGFLAQEVEQAAKDAGYDFSGVERPQNAHDLYHLRYGDLVTPLVKAVQEQQQTIEELRQRLSALERMLNATSASK